jgi:pimeloyl-ACP methyl ester carboxylesterase
MVTPPLWVESLWAIDWLTLHLSPVYYGLGVPAGDGGAVITVPGFMCSDAMMLEMHEWLRRIGYRPFLSGIGFNADCPGILAERLATTVRYAARQTGRPVRIVGHSLGGIIARKVAVEQPEDVSQIVYLGTPLQAVRAHPQIMATGQVLVATAMAVRGRECLCFTEECECGFTETAAQALPKSVRHAAIYTQADGVVDWHDATEDHPRLNHEVGGTHLGLPYNWRAYRALGHIFQDRRKTTP